MRSARCNGAQRNLWLKATTIDAHIDENDKVSHNHNGRLAGYSLDTHQSRSCEMSWGTFGDQNNVDTQTDRERERERQRERE